MAEKKNPSSKMTWKAGDVKIYKNEKALREHLKTQGKRLKTPAK